MTQRKPRVSGNLTIRQLEVFAVAARSSTFSEAAKRLDISQPTLSNMIAKIEEQLGLSLFDRTTRTMALTAEGDRLSVVAQDLVATFQASLRSIHDTARRRHGRLSMAVLPSVASSVAPKAIELFLKDYPDFDVALHDTTRQDGLVWVLDRVVDFGILTSAPKLSELASETLHTDPYHVVCHRDSAIAGRASLDWEQLAEQPMILTGTPQIRRDIESAWTQAGVSIAPRFEVENIMTGLGLVSSNLGVTILPRIYLAATVNPSLVSMPLSKVDFSRNIDVVHRADRVLSTPIAHMIDCFRQTFAALHPIESAKKPHRKRV